MSDEMIEWYENQDVEELLDKFVKQQKLSKEWMTFLYDEWVSDQADRADYLFETTRDMQLEETKNV